jgi:hypothetical protein
MGVEGWAWWTWGMMSMEADVMRSARQSTRRSPLRERPLRLPGESIQEEIDNLAFDELVPWVMTIVVVAFYALMEWIQFVTKARPNPWLVSGIAVLVVGYSLYRLRRATARLRLLKQGLRGERAVAEVLDELRAGGAAVYHDIPGDGFNVDHVVLTRRGVFAIETKTISKRPDSRVTFRDGVLLVDGRSLDRDPLKQARAAADWIQGTLKASTGITFPVRGVVLFPGWFVEPMSKTNGTNTWVLNPKALAAFIDKEPMRLSDPDLHLAAYHLARYVRSVASAIRG